MSSLTGLDDVCPICLCVMDEEFARPENCQHRFDLECLTQWSKLRLSCPSCRSTFGAVYSYKIVESKPVLHKVQKMEPPKEPEPFDETDPLDFTVCEICSGGMHEELLLICDQCDKGFHTYCLTPPLDSVPTSEQWFCPQCERSRIALPSTSHSAPSARTIRLVQRTALAERVRRILARSRHLIHSDESSTGEDDDDDDDNDIEDEDEEEEDIESVASSEDEKNQFFDDDARVLGDIEVDISYDRSSLPSVKRRTKKERHVKKTSKKTRGRKVSKKSGRGKQRRNKGTLCKRRTKEAETLKDPFINSVPRRSGPREPLTRLSLLGAELEPIADPPVTENSRRFDQPLSHRKQSFKDEKPAVDSCDLLGSIIPEQMKTLAPGRLFAVKGGRFNTTEHFEKYKRKKTSQLSLELRERLGMTTDPEEPSVSTKAKDYPKANSSDVKNLSSEARQSISSSSQLRRTEKKAQIKSEDREIFRQIHHEDKNSSLLEKHQHVDQKLYGREQQRFVKPATDKLHHQDIGSRNERGSRKESAHEEMKCKEDNYKRRQDPGCSHPEKCVHSYQDSEYLSSRSSNGVPKNEESEQEDRSSFTKHVMDEKAVTGSLGCVNDSMPEFQNSMVTPSVKPSSSMNSNFITSESKEGKNKSEDVLKIIDGFAKEGIRPYKREITVQEYKDVMRAVVRECYKKKILDGDEIKTKVKECIETLKRGEPLLFGCSSSKRPEINGHLEFSLPTKRSKTDS